MLSNKSKMTHNYYAEIHLNWTKTNLNIHILKLRGYTILQGIWYTYKSIHTFGR